jgi:hypothetical protein
MAVQQCQTFVVHGGEFRLGLPGSPTMRYITIDRQLTARQGQPVKRQVGAQLEIAFKPSDDVSVIGREIQTVSLVQIVRDRVQVAPVGGGAPVPLVQHNVAFGLVGVPPAHVHAGWTIDQDILASSGVTAINRDPRHAQKRLLATEKINSEDPRRGAAPGRPSSGYAAARQATRSNQFSFALLGDRPTASYDPAIHQIQGGMDFEIAALADGTARVPAFWLGSVSWGWDIVDNAPTLRPVAVLNAGNAAPSAAFLAARAQWNGALVAGSPLLQLP